jgi:acyl carrier protein
LKFEQLTTEIKTLILHAAKIQDIKPEEITDDEPIFAEGLGLDSIDMLEIIVQLDKKYGIKLQNDETGRKALSNVGNLARSIQTHLEQNRSGGV